MSAVASASGVQIRVEMDGSRWVRIGDADWRDSVAMGIRARAAELLADLHLEAEPNISIEEVHRASVGAEPGIRVGIDGTSCRVDHSARVAAPYAIEAVRAIGATLYWNRELLLTPALLHRLYRRYADGRNDTRREIPRDAFDRLMAELVVDGFSAGTATSLLDEWTERVQRGFTRDYQFEALHAAHFAKTICVQLAPRLYGTVMDDTRRTVGEAPERTRQGMVGLMREGLFYELGLKFPDVVFDLDENLRGSEFRARFNAVRGPVQEGLAEDEILVNATSNQLEALVGGPVRTAVNPANDFDASITRAENTDRCEAAGYTTWDSTGYVILALSRQLRRHAAAFLTMAQCENALLLLNEAFPMSVFNLLERYSMPEVRAVLAALVAEEVSIRDLRSILEALLEINGQSDAGLAKPLVVTVPDAHYVATRQSAPTIADRVEFVRAALARQITHKHARGSKRLPASLLSRAMEERIGRAGEDALNDRERQSLIAAVAADYSQRASGNVRSPIVTTVDVRRRLANLLSREFPHVAVLSYREVQRGTSIDPLSRIDWLDVQVPVPDSSIQPLSREDRLDA